MASGYYGARPCVGLMLASVFALCIVSSCGGDSETRVRCGLDQEMPVCHCTAEERFQSDWRPVDRCSKEQFPCCFRDLDNGDCFCTLALSGTDPNGGSAVDCRNVPVRNAQIIDSCPWTPLSASGAEPH
jgi:hypothetical protein